MPEFLVLIYSSLKSLTCQTYKLFNVPGKESLPTKQKAPLSGSFLRWANFPTGDLLQDLDQTTLVVDRVVAGAEVCNWRRRSEGRCCCGIRCYLAYTPDLYAPLASRSCDTRVERNCEEEVS